MKREELLAKGYTEEQVTDILNTYHNLDSEVKKLKEDLNSKSELEKKNEDLQKQIDAINEANLTEQEKLAKQKEEIAKNLADSKKIYNTAKAKEILAGLDIDESLISALVSDDEAKTIEQATLLKNKIEFVKESTAKQTKDEIANLDVKPQITNTTQNDVMTWDKYRTLSQEEQNKFAMEHPVEFANL